MDRSGLISGAVLFAAAAVFLFRNMRTRRVTLGRMWLVPVLLCVVAVLTLLGNAPTEMRAPLATSLAVVVGLLAGMVLGLARGHTSRIRLGEQPGTLYMDPSPLLIGIWLASFASKFVLRATLPQIGIVGTALTDFFIVFATSSVVVARITIFRKYEALRAADRT